MGLIGVRVASRKGDHACTFRERQTPYGLQPLTASVVATPKKPGRPSPLFEA
jgi:hypothetical protein